MKRGGGGYATINVQNLIKPTNKLRRKRAPPRKHTVKQASPMQAHSTTIDIIGIDLLNNRIKQ
jgi:hypothetical protein